MATMAVPFVYANHGVLIVTLQSNDGSHTWRNSIDVVWDESVGPPAPTDGVVVAFHDYIKGLTRDDTHIIKMALTPYSKGDVPFSQQGNIWEVAEFTPCKNWGPGTAHPDGPSSGITPLGEICAMMVKPKFGPGGGRPGRMFHRNAISQDQVIADAGGPPTLGSLGALYPAEMNAWATAKLSPYCTFNPLPRFVLVHASVVARDANGKPTQYDVFDTAMAVPIFQRLTMHDIGKD